MDRWSEDPYEAGTTNKRFRARRGTRRVVDPRSGTGALTRADRLDETFGGHGLGQAAIDGDRSGSYDLAPTYAEDDDDAVAGPRLTPFRVAVTLAVVGSLVAIAYALFVERGGTQIPILVSGLAVFGVSLVMLSAAGAIKSVRAAENGYGGRAFWAALLGGMCAIVAAGSLGGAVVLALVWRSAT